MGEGAVGRASAEQGQRRAKAVLARLVAEAIAGEVGPRLLVILAHPDDEVLALGARLERLGSSQLLCVTDGAPEDGGDSRAHGFSTRAAYAEARRGELGAALRLAGLPPGVARQMFLPGGAKFSGGGSAGSAGTASGGADDGRAVSDQGAMFHLTELTRVMAGEIREFAPEAILTHPYEGGHPDHDACAFAVHAAMALLRGERAVGSDLPILEAPFYHSRGVWEAGESGTVTGRFLPGDSGGRGALPEPFFTELAADESERKRERLACFATQRETLALFGTEREGFREAPEYDFTLPPHAGPLLYESFGWGLDGARFRELAAEALRELGLA